MATTTNYGWETPDDTDLVKDGALAMRTLGNSIDTSLAELRGGTTGQVLSKTSNAQMDFTWVTPDDANAIQNAIVDAKGDLITATAADTPARLAVGSNGDTLVADSAATTGLRWQGNYSAGKNKIINGNFDIWQRGTSFSPVTNTGVYNADRFLTFAEGTGATRTISRQTFTPGSAPVAGYESQYFLRFNQSVGPSGAIGNNLLHTRLEDVRTFAGQTVTFSFWAKAASSITLPQVYAWQVFGTGGSPSGNVMTDFATNVVIGTSWTRYSYTITIPSISGKTIGTNNDSYLDIRLQMPLGAGVTFTFDTWGWQLEAGNVATAFQTATGTLQGELAACQRYYIRYASTADNNAPFANGICYSTTAARLYFGLPVQMRGTSVTTDFSTLQFIDSSIGIFTVSAVTSPFSFAGNSIMVDATITGATQGRSGWLRQNGAASSSYIGFSAEL